jgi:hypothetical protein
MFHGSDANERTTLLILQGTLSQAEKTSAGNDQRVLTPTGLLLFYVADAKAPDVYRLPAGSFQSSTLPKISARAISDRVRHAPRRRTG